MMNYKGLKEKNINNLQTTTSTELQADVGNTDTSLYKNKQNNLELIEYKIEEFNKKINKLEHDIEEINMPLIDKLNKYKIVLSWLACIIATISVIIFHLYDNSIQTHFANLEEKITNLSIEGQELKTDIKEINQKQNSLEIRFIENKKK